MHPLIAVLRKVESPVHAKLLWTLLSAYIQDVEAYAGEGDEELKTLPEAQALLDQMDAAMVAVAEEETVRITRVTKGAQ